MNTGLGSFCRNPLKTIEHQPWNGPWWTNEPVLWIGDWKNIKLWQKSSWLQVQPLSFPLAPSWCSINHGFPSLLNRYELNKHSWLATPLYFPILKCLGFSACHVFIRSFGRTWSWKQHDVSRPTWGKIASSQCVVDSMCQLIQSKYHKSCQGNMFSCYLHMKL